MALIARLVNQALDVLPLPSSQSMEVNWLRKLAAADKVLNGALRHAKAVCQGRGIDIVGRIRTTYLTFSLRHVDAYPTGGNSGNSGNTVDLLQLFALVRVPTSARVGTPVFQSSASAPPSSNNAEWLST